MESIKIIVFSILAAITYGIIHDQITAHICVEYFTIGHARVIQSESPFILALVWGVIATWWVGLSLGILLAFSLRTGKYPKLTYKDLKKPMLILLICMFCIAFIAGVIGFTTSKLGIFILVRRLAMRVPEEQHCAFLAVGWAHSASYLAGIVGGIILCIKTLKKRIKLEQKDSCDRYLADAFRNMWKKYKRKIYITCSIIIILIILGLVGYKWRKSYQIEKANNAFDPIERKLHGIYLLRPVGKPSLFGMLDRANAERLREKFNIKNGGSAKKDNMELVIHASDNSFFVHYK